MTRISILGRTPSSRKQRPATENEPEQLVPPTPSPPAHELEMEPSVSPSPMKITKAPTLFKEKLAVLPPPRSEPNRVFVEKDEFGSVAKLAKQYNPAQPDSKRMSLAVHGLRRPFRASFGFRDQIVIPRGDGSVEIRRLPSEGFIENQRPELVSMLRVHAQEPSRTSWVSPQNQLVFGALNAAWGTSETEEPFHQQAEHCQAALEAHRVESMDAWVRTALEPIRKKSQSASGLLVGDAKAEVERLENESKSRSAKQERLDALRAATIAAQGPGIGGEVYPFVARTAESEGSTPSKHVNDVIRICRIMSGRSNFRRDFESEDPAFERQWIRAFAYTFWNRQRVLDPLVSILHDYLQGTDRTKIPTDGLFKLLCFLANPRVNGSLFIPSLMRLRSDVNDWSVPWLVTQLAIQANMVQISPRSYALLTMSFCHQLERAEMIDWAVYVCYKALSWRTAGDDNRRRKAIYELLTKYWRGYFARRPGSDMFLKTKVGIPYPYIHHARAFTARSENEKLAELWKSGEFTELAFVFGQHRGPLAVITEDGTVLHEALELHERVLSVPSISALWPVRKSLHWVAVIAAYLQVRRLDPATEEFGRALNQLLNLLTDENMELHFRSESLSRVALEHMAQFVARSYPIRSIQDVHRILRTQLSPEARKEFLAANAHVLIT